MSTEWEFNPDLDISYDEVKITRHGSGIAVAYYKKGKYIATMKVSECDLCRGDTLTITGLTGSFPIKGC